MLASPAPVTIQAAFSHAAKKGERLVSIDGGPAQPPIACSGCGCSLDPPLAYAALGLDNEQYNDDDETFCGECRAMLLGPPCMACKLPVSRADGLLALEGHWHRMCLRCSHESCRALLGERHFAHEGKPYCRVHYLERAGEKCAKCGVIVDGGVRALGRAWHEECLRCAESDEQLGPGTAYLHEGRPVAPASRLKTAPRCHACGEPAISDRLYAHGCVYHDSCFKCVHCRAHIGERKFVVFDGEPYLDGCYQKLFGASAGEAMRTQVHGTLVRHAVNVPLLLSLGATGRREFAVKHGEMMPAVRRLLRESGVQQFTSFLFEPPAVSKPSLVLTMLLPATIDANDALPTLLAEDKVGLQWMQLLDSVHDVGASRNHPWHTSVTKELRGNAADTSVVADGPGAAS